MKTKINFDQLHLLTSQEMREYKAGIGAGFLFIAMAAVALIYGTYHDAKMRR